VCRTTASQESTRTTKLISAAGACWETKRKENKEQTNGYKKRDQNKQKKTQ
jgi:hypothetical protein